MSEITSPLGMATSLLLPWILGSVWVFWLLRPSGRWSIFIITGHGYLVGVFLTTLLIRLWHLAGLPLHYWALAVVLSALSVAGVVAVRLQQSPVREVMRSNPLQRWEVAITAFFLLLIAWRYATIAQELILRPLFPWDAWMNWAPKAITWFHYNDLISFVSRDNWLNAPAEALKYSEGAPKAWQYPVTIPLLQLWGMLGAGTSDHTLIYLPWLCVAMAIGLSLFGHLRQAGVSIPVATLACYVLLSLPFMNVHTALAGYADIWVAAAFGCAVFALHEWDVTRQWPYALLALVLALMCTQLKIPGLIMGGIVLTVLLTSLIKINKASLIVLLAGLAISLLAITTIGIESSIPGIGRIVITTSEINLPYIGHYKLAYHPVHGAIINTVFLMTNWNMLGYLFCLVTLALVVKPHIFASPPLVLRALTLTLLFIFFVYFFSNRYKFAQDFTQVNRALVYSIPVIVYYLFNTIYSSFTPKGTCNV